MKKKQTNHTKTKHKNTSRLGMWFGILLFAGIAILILFGINAFANTPKEPVVIDEPATVNPRGALVTFTFDDGFKDTYTKAAPTLAKYGLNGVAYVSTGCVDGLNECEEHFGRDKKFMTWDEIRDLQNTYKWEIGSHSVTHPLLTKIDSTRKEYEIKTSKDILEKNGLRVTNFASPHGDYDEESLGLIAKYYDSHRGFHNTDKNKWPFDNAVLQVKQVQGNVSVDEVKKAVDEAIAKKQWLVLVLHTVSDRPNKNKEAYENATADLDAMAAYVKKQQDAKLIQNVTVSKALAITDPNLLPSGTFADIKPKGWTADDPTNIIRDNQLGSFPSSDSSIRFTGSGKPLHYESPAVTVSSNNTYMIKAYTDTRQKVSGDFGYYLDEYDATGDWVSLSWLGFVNLKEITYFSAPYKPTSSRVAYVKLKAYMGKNPAGKVYIDNVAFYNTTEAK